LRAEISIAQEQNALSARTVSGPVAPAWRSRLMVSVRKLFAPRAAGRSAAEPGEDHLPVSGSVANCG
jgi:hypothetical protein